MFPQQENHSQHSAPTNDEHLIKMINGAIVASYKERSQEKSAHELQRLLTGPAMGAILRATRTLATEQQIPEAESAALIVQTFQKLDKIWSDYLIQEGLEKIRGSSS